MQQLLRALGFSIGLLFMTVSAHAQDSTALEDAQRASSEQIQQLSNQLHALKAKTSFSALAQLGLIQRLDFNGRDCGGQRPPPPPPAPNECVQNCVSRYSNGTCATYGADYCAPAASCALNCISRYSNGTCATYGADVCGPYASCTQSCISRYSNGTCATYGPDVCN